MYSNRLPCPRCGTYNGLPRSGRCGSHFLPYKPSTLTPAPRPEPTREQRATREWASMPEVVYDALDGLCKACSMPADDARTCPHCNHPHRRRGWN